MFKVEVLIEHPVQALDRGFSYLSKKPILTGIRVQVPFNHRQVVGYVLSVEEVDLTQKAETPATEIPSYGERSGFN